MCSNACIAILSALESRNLLCQYCYFELKYLGHVNTIQIPITLLAILSALESRNLLCQYCYFELKYLGHVNTIQIPITLFLQFERYHRHKCIYMKIMHRFANLVSNSVISSFIASTIVPCNRKTEPDNKYIFDYKI